MRNARIICILLIVICINDNSYSQDNSLVRTKLREIYYSQIGVKEATGRNDGEVVKYLKPWGLGAGNQYCSGFVSWCFLQLKDYISDCPTGPNTVWAPSCFPKKRTIYVRGKYQTKVPEMGDLVGFTWNQDRIRHVGFYDAGWGGNMVQCVEGNTSASGQGLASANGGGVYKKWRLKNQITHVSDWITKK